MSKQPEKVLVENKFYQDDTFHNSEIGQSPTGRITDTTNGKPKEQDVPLPADQVTIMGHVVDAAKLKLLLDIIASTPAHTVPPTRAAEPVQEIRAQNVTPRDLNGALEEAGPVKTPEEPRVPVVDLSPSRTRGRTASPRHRRGLPQRSERSPTRQSRRRSPTHQSRRRSPTRHGEGSRIKDTRSRSPRVVRHLVRQPLNDYVLDVPVPTKLKLPPISYKGEGDPSDHAEAFESHMSVWSHAKRPCRGLRVSAAEVFALSKSEGQKWERPPRPRSDGDTSQYCEYHGHTGHLTDNCRHLKNVIEELIRKGSLSKYGGPGTK
uniref:Gag n=1 Tax=Silene latifolia TaxID=37657 RepID=Q1AP01_SILLA|nr:gag [Silene latifolia]